MCEICDNKQETQYEHDIFNQRCYEDEFQEFCEDELVGRFTFLLCEDCIKKVEKGELSKELKEIINNV